MHNNNWYSFVKIDIRSLKQIFAAINESICQCFESKMLLWNKWCLFTENWTFFPKQINTWVSTSITVKTSSKKPFSRSFKSKYTRRTVAYVCFVDSLLRRFVDCHRNSTETGKRCTLFSFFASLCSHLHSNQNTHEPNQLHCCISHIDHKCRPHLNFYSLRMQSHLNLDFNWKCLLFCLHTAVVGIPTNKEMNELLGLKYWLWMSGDCGFLAVHVCKLVFTLRSREPQLSMFSLCESFVIERAKCERKRESMSRLRFVLNLSGFFIQLSVWV